MIELVKEPTRPKIDNGEFESDNEESKNAKDLIAVSIQTLVDYSNPETMRVSRYLKRQLVTILIDTSSTNNFLEEDVA
jgi:hypothetical protein